MMTVQKSHALAGYAETAPLQPVVIQSLQTTPLSLLKTTQLSLLLPPIHNTLHKYRYIQTHFSGRYIRIYEE
jgi:hypothetical protein